MKAQHDHRQIHVQQHLHVGLLHHDVGGRLDAGVAGGQQELALRRVVFLGKLAATVPTTWSRVVGLVVLKVGITGSSNTRLNRSGLFTAA
jgi:hypothetical protein